MDTNTDAVRQDGAQTIVQIPAPTTAAISTRDAARSVASFRLKAREGEDTSTEGTPAEGARRVDQSANANTPEEAAPVPEAEAAPSEKADPSAGETPIDPPRSWSKEAREQFQSLPRETQEFLAQREQEHDREMRRGESEAGEQRKALEAERGRAEQARINYETALPVLLANMQQQHAGDFSDVKSIVDVERLAREDWPRYVLWDAQQKRISETQRQLQDATLRQGQERQIRLGHFVQREQELFIEKNPDLADPVQRAKLTETAAGMLRELGFSDQELNDCFHGRRELNLHDHRVQTLIRDGVRFREAQRAARQASAKPVPPVHRPGVAQPKGAAHEAAVQSLAKRLDQTGSLKDAARLLAERRKAMR